MEFKQDTLVRLQTKLVIEKSAGQPDGQFTAVLSTDDLDRHGEHVSISGLTIPTGQVIKMYYNHQTYGDNLPIGTWLKIWKSGNKLMGQGEFDLDDDFAVKVYNKVKKGVIDSISIGFYPQEFDSEAMTWTKSTLVEASVVAEPANVAAVITSKELGFTNDDFEKSLIVRLKLVDKKAPNWVAIPITHTSVDANSAWSAKDNVKNIPDSAGAADLKNMYACVDKNANPHVKSAYKFPHHMVSSDGKIGPANLKACTTGISILNGSMNGSKIGSARQGVYDHLAAHIKDASETPPALKSLETISQDGADDTDIKTAFEELKSRVGAVEETLKASTESPAIKQTIRVRMAVKEVDKAAESLNRILKVKLKGDSNNE